MLYFSYHLKSLNPPITYVDICLRDNKILSNISHTAEEIQAALPDAKVRLISIGELQILGPGQIVVWQVENIDWTGRLPKQAKSVLAGGAILGLCNHQERRLVIIKPGGYYIWVWRMWLQHIYYRWYLIGSPYRFAKFTKQIVVRILNRLKIV